MMCKPPEVPLKKRWLLYTGSWGAAFLSFFIPPSFLAHIFAIRYLDHVLVLVILCSWTFPSGLATWFNHPKPWDDHGLIALLWLAYIVHGVFILRSRTRVRFYSLLLILAIVLVFNVRGCYRIKPIGGFYMGSVEPSSLPHSGFRFCCYSRPNAGRNPRMR
jgi:hypothetical protein